MKKKANKLTYQQQIALVDMLRSKHKDFAERRLTRDEVAIEINKALGFDPPINSGHINSAMIAASIEPWAAKVTRSAKSKTPPSYNIRVLASAVVKIADSLGIAVDKDDYLRFLAKADPAATDATDA